LIDRESCAARMEIAMILKERFAQNAIQIARQPKLDKQKIDKTKDSEMTRKVNL
jgi:hypothetical protein